MSLTGLLLASPAAVGLVVPCANAAPTGAVTSKTADAKSNFLNTARLPLYASGKSTQPSPAPCGVHRAVWHNLVKIKPLNGIFLALVILGLRVWCISSPFV